MPDETVVLDNEDIRRTLVRIAHEIVERTGGEDLAVVGIHRRGAILAARLHELVAELADGDVPLGDIDTVITLCAEEACALPPGGLVQHHWALDDPTAATGSEDEILSAFRRTREDIRRRLEELLEKSR